MAMSRFRRRLALELFQRDVALLLGCAVIGAVIEVFFEGPPLAASRLVVIGILGVVNLVPLLVLVRFARRRTDAGRQLSPSQLVLGIGIAAVLGVAVTTFPGPYEISGLAVDGVGGLVRAALFVGAVELHARAVRGQALAHGMREATTRLEAELQEARARLLEAQIEPHFLFNTLANVRELQRSDPRTGLAMLDDLIDYLARSLPGLGRERTTLDEERALVAAYLRLHRPRFGPRLRYDIAFPPPLLDCELPCMVLLTLVENSLKHGLGPLPEGGAITLSAETSGEALVVDVVDTGAGMGAGTGGGTGLANIRSRLALRYGDAARLTLSLNEPRGVRASLRIPLARAPTA
jgi:Histidine kinase